MGHVEYWRERFSILEDAAHQKGDRYLQDLEKTYQDAALSVKKEIESWYQRFAENNEINLIDARRLLTTREREEFRWSVAQYIKIGEQANLSPEWMRKLENASARFHISRLETLQMQIQQQIELLYGNRLDALDRLFRDTVSNHYTKGAFEIQKGLGLGWDFTALDQRKLDLLLYKPWTTDERTFRDRCWSNKQTLVDAIHKRMIQGVLRGDSPKKTIDAISHQFGVDRYKAARLVHTEISYFNALSKNQMYRDLGIEQIEVVETLDTHTCAVCQPMDGIVLPLSQYQPGVTVPPFHPNCRGTTCPRYDDPGGERAARNADGEVYYVPADMTYPQWKKTFVEGGSKDGLTAYTVNAILERAVRRKAEVSDVQNIKSVGRIDIEKYRCVTQDIATDEVIITEERIAHIEEDHPGDFERYGKYIREIVANPDYILQGNKPHTAVVLKEVEVADERFKLILRLKIESDPQDYKNSIISFWQIGETTWKKNLKNKKILYKKA